MLFFRVRTETNLHFLRHLGTFSKGGKDLWSAYMKKLFLTPVTKNFEVWANLWMLASLASQIPILSFGVASAWIGIFPIRSLRSLIGKILPIPSQFFVTGVKIRYWNWIILVKIGNIKHKTDWLRFSHENSIHWSKLLSLNDSLLEGHSNFWNLY